MKPNPETVKRWKQANWARVLEMNRKWYHKNKHKLRPLKGTAPQAHLKKQICACGNVAFKLTSSGYVCERCDKAEIWNTKHEKKNRQYEDKRIYMPPSVFAYSTSGFTHSSGSNSLGDSIIL